VGRVGSVQEVIDREEIREVIYRYCRGVDRGDVEILRSVYHEDASDDHGMFKGTGFEFADWIVNFEPVKTARTCYHNVGNIIIDLDGDVAHVEAYAVSVRDDGVQVSTTHSRYIDRFEKRAGEWKIARRVVLKDGGFAVPSSPQGASQMSQAVTPGRRDKQDLSYIRG
jgi:ketosteroid isomerase-like protein